MPVFQITAPDGRKFRINAPDGASKEQALAYAQQQFAAQPAKPTYRDPEGDYSPTEGQSFASNALAGAGKSAIDTYEGLKQMLGFGDQTAIDERARLDKDLMQTGGGLVGNIGGQIAQMAVPGAVLGKLGMGVKAATTLGKVAQAAAGAGAFAATQPVLTGDSRLGNAATGAAWGAGGQLASSGLSRLAKGGKDAIEPALRDLAMKAESYGIPVTMGQLTDSRFVRTLKSVVDKLPFSGSQKLQGQQQKAFNRAVAQTFGESADNITTDVAAAAKRRIGGAFDALSTRNKLKVDGQLLDDLVSLSDEASKTGTADNARAVTSLVDDFLGKTENGQVSGKAYRELDSRIGRLIKGTQDGDKRHYLGRLRDSIRDAMDRSISPTDSKAWQAARKQYRNLKTVEDLIEKSATGDLSPSLLLGLVRRADKNMAYTGGGELGDLARIGQRFLKDPIPNSGTAERLLAAGAVGGGGYALGIDPATLATMALAGRGIGGVLNSNAGRRYMLQGAPALERLGAPLPYLLPATANAQQ